MATTKPKVRCRVREEQGRIWIRFLAKPSEEVRRRLKESGAQYVSVRGAWLLPAGEQ